VGLLELGTEQLLAPEMAIREVRGDCSIESLAGERVLQRVLTTTAYSIIYKRAFMTLSREAAWGALTMKSISLFRAILSGFIGQGISWAPRRSRFMAFIYLSQVHL
jgi:hypothetical protein